MLLPVKGPPAERQSAASATASLQAPLKLGQIGREESGSPVFSLLGLSMSLM